MQHRWFSAYDWLEDASKRWDRGKLRQALLELAGRDCDAIQDLHQDEMERDGYFEPHFDEGEIEVGLAVKVRQGCDDSHAGEVGRVCANVDRSIALPILVYFVGRDDYEVFSRFELTSPTLEERAELERDEKEMFDEAG